MTKKRGGPYPKMVQEQRREEVSRLWFDYGYSIIEISKMMKVNRNTISKDLEYIYKELGNTNESVDPQFYFLTCLERLEFQRDRIRKMLDKTESLQLKFSIERLLEIEAKIINIIQRTVGTENAIKHKIDNVMNEQMKKNNLPDRYVAGGRYYSVSAETKSMIDDLIEKDYENRIFRTRNRSNLMVPYEAAINILKKGLEITNQKSNLPQELWKVTLVKILKGSMKQEKALEVI